MKTKLILILQLSLSLALAFTWFLVRDPETIRAAPELDCSPTQYHSGTISSDERWCLSNSPHYISGSSVTVNSSVTLTIDPGVQVIFDPGTSLIVNGALFAIGNTSQTIYFKSTSVSTTFSNIFLNAGSTADLYYCDISRATGSNGAVNIYSSGVTLDTCVIHDSTPIHGAVYIQGAGIAPTIRNAIIQDNSNYAIYQNTPDMAPTYDDLTLSGNGTDAVYLHYGSINRNLALDGRELGGKPLIAGGSLGVPSGYTLTLAPGTELRLPQAGGSGSEVHVYNGGTLIAEGTQSEKVVLASTGPSDHYTDLAFDPGATASLAYCDVSGAGWSSALYIRSSSVTVDHCTIHDNPVSTGAIYFNAAGITPTIENTVLQNNGGYAIYQSTPDMAPTYDNLTLNGNGTDAVYLYYGSINRNVILDGRELGGKPFIAGGSLGVPSGYTLTLAPGTELRLPQAGGSGSEVHVYNGGTLIAEGTQSEEVVFASTSSSDHYTDLAFDPGATASLAYCDVSGAGWNSALYIRSSNVTVDHCTIHDNPVSTGAIYFNAAGITPMIENTVIQNNGGYAIYQSTVDMTPVYENLTATGNGTDAIQVGHGSITIGRAWTLGQSGLPAYADDWLNIDSSAFLVLDPGTELKFIKNQMHVYGSFYALGTPTDPITISGDIAAPGEWSGVYFDTNSSAILDNVTISYGGSGGYLAYIRSSDVTIQNSKIANSSTDGIQVSAAKPVLHYNQIVDNGGYGLKNLTPATVVDATNNWWGDASGPYHATTNPGGLGDPVTNGVLFDPWLGEPEHIGDLPIGRVYVDLVSQTRASPGQSVNYAIWYNNLSATPVENAVLVLALPRGVDFRSSSASGIYWPSRNQVFWKLGTFDPGASGAVAVQAAFRWGIPDLTLDSAMAIMLGDELDSGQLTLQDYLDYDPHYLASRTTLTKAQFESALPSMPDLETLYNQALVDGYVPGGFNDLTLNTSQVFKQVTLAKPDLSEVMFIYGTPQFAIATIIGRTYITQVTPTDTMTWDLQTNYVDYSQKSFGKTILRPDIDKHNCLLNCLVLEAGTSLILEFMPILGKLMNGGTCETFLLDPSNTDALTSCLGGAVPILGTLVTVANCYKNSLADPNYCTCSADRWEGTTMPLAKTEACKKTPCVDGLYQTWNQGVYSCATCTKCIGGSGGSSNPADHCKPTGATAPTECRTSTNFPLGSSPAAPSGQDDDIFNGLKICNIIPKDPNAKYGREGDLVPGQVLTYTITYENEGAGRAYGVFITDVLDENLDDATLTLGDDAFYIPGARKIFWNIGELGPKGDLDSKGVVTFTVQLKEDLPGGTPVFNQAIVYFPSVPEATPTNAMVNYVQDVTALPQEIETDYMTPVGITLQGMDVSGTPLTFEIKEQPFFGTLSGTPPDIIYTPQEDYTGQDKFSYTAFNGVSTSNAAEVSIIIHPSANDAQAPQVLWTAPANNAADVPYRESSVMSDPLGPIYAPFPIVQLSEAMDLETLVTENVTVTNSTGQTMSVTLDYDELGNQLTIYPREGFSSGVWYTVTIDAAVADQMGNPLGTDYVFTFEIGSPVDINRVYLPVVIK